MAKLGRPGLTDAQKAELWDRWQRGEFQSEIARVLGKFPASIFGMLSLHGGIRPATRRRAPLTLTLTHRECISGGLAAERPPEIEDRAVPGHTGRAA